MADALTRLGISVAADGDYNWGDVSGGVNSLNTALQTISSRGMWTGVDNPGTYSVSGLLTFTGSGGVSGNLAVSGNVGVGSGISFPATQVPSSDSNTLDDYEEGTWTPELAIGGVSTGITYSAQGGRYTKIGNMISFSLDCALSSKAALTGALTISLPITASTPAHPDLVIVALNIDNSNTTEKIQGLIIGSASIISLYSVQPNAVLDNTDINDNSNIRISGTYFTA